MFGGYVSLYLAVLCEVDPCNVDFIVGIKSTYQSGATRMSSRHSNTNPGSQSSIN